MLVVLGFWVELNLFEVSWELVLVFELAIATDEDLSTWLDHLWGECELLAVQSKGGSVLLNGGLGVVCSILEHVDPFKGVSNGIKVIKNGTQLDLNHVLMCHDVLTVDENFSFRFCKLHLEEELCILESFKGNHEVGLNSQVMLILLFHKDHLGCIEIIDVRLSSLVCHVNFHLVHL